MEPVRLLYDPKLQGAQVWRARRIARCSMLRLAFEAVVQFGAARSFPISCASFVFDRDTPGDRMTPAIIRVDETTYRVEAWHWKREPRLAIGISFLLVDAPKEWPQE